MTFFWCFDLAGIGKILIVGKGFFGEKLFSMLQSRGIEVEATMQPLEQGFIPLDITDKASVENVISNSHAETVVLTAAVSSVDYCEQHKEETFNVNVQGTKNVVAACKKNLSKLVFLSTDYVFDGKKRNYSENDKPNPLQYYGATKLLGEQDVLGQLDDSLVLRVSSLYGFNSQKDKPCFPVFVINQLIQGKQVNASLQITCPTLIDDAANALIQLVKKNEKGIFHVVGADALSRIAVAKAVAMEFGLDSKLIKKTGDLHFVAMRPEDSSLSTKKLNSVGIKMNDFKNGLKTMKKQMEAAV